MYNASAHAVVQAKPDRPSHASAHWADSAVFYHLFPLGVLGAPGIDQPEQATEYRASQTCPARKLGELLAWIDHAQSLGCTAILLGPVFQSESHGYDTIDYHQVDDRLGTNQDLRLLVNYCHQNGLQVVLDGVFNHAGRSFHAFRDLQEHRQQSMFSAWFSSVDFSRSSPAGDPFSYEGWNGHYNLVTFNHSWPWTRRYLLDTLQFWIREFNIDGVRLDAADCLPQDFLADLSDTARALKLDFWLMGEVVHGDYRQWQAQGRLDTVTNYEAYKGLWSSFADGNFFEIAWTLRRQSGPEGMYRSLRLYNFADNHDVDRVASLLPKTAWLYPLYCLLFTMPGIPSVYYGSEWGQSGQRQPGSDKALRPALSLQTSQRPEPDLCRVITALSRLRREHAVLIDGDYHQICVSHQQFCFARQLGNRIAIIVINSDSSPALIDPFTCPAWMRDGSTLNASMLPDTMRFSDVLNGYETFTLAAGSLAMTIPANWARILVSEA